jgi:hypothetical protein
LEMKEVCWVWLQGGKQVLLLPNFVMTVTREIYQSDDYDGFDTIDLDEQVCDRVCAALPIMCALPC